MWRTHRSSFTTSAVRSGVTPTLARRTRPVTSAVAFLFCSAFITLGATAPEARTNGTPPTPNVVEGRVTLSDGRPVRGATIRVAGATGAARGTTRTATTDAAGRYRVAVPLGHYNVDGFADITYDGQTYQEFWLDRVNAGCDRVMSDKGIVRNFVLRLSGPKRCTNGSSPNNPNSYNGAYITAMSSAFPADAVITFTLRPVGPLADGSRGQVLTMRRTGAALQKGGGPIDETSFLYDIPLGRYRMSAEARYADGSRRGVTLELRDGTGASGSDIEIAFAANKFGGGIRPVGIGLTPGAGLGGVVSTPKPPVQPAAQQPVPAPAARPGAELPLGRYACSYRSEYAGDIPTSASVTIQSGGKYVGYGAAGTYELDAASRTVRWMTGPFAAAGVRATYAQRNGQSVITVAGGPAAADPGKTNTCVLSGG